MDTQTLSPTCNADFLHQGAIVAKNMDSVIFYTEGGKVFGMKTGLDIVEGFSVAFVTYLNDKTTAIDFDLVADHVNRSIYSVSHANGLFLLLDGRSSAHDLQEELKSHQTANAIEIPIFNLSPGITDWSLFSSYVTVQWEDSNTYSTEEQRTYIEEKLRTIGDLSEPITLQLYDNFWTASVVFENTKLATQAVWLLNNKALPFGEDSYLCLWQQYQADIRLPTTLWKQCRSKVLVEVARHQDCQLHKKHDTDESEITICTYDRRVAVNVRTIIEQLAESAESKERATSPQPNDNTETSNNETHTCVICYDTCSPKDSITGGCGHSFCTECFTAYVHEGGWTRQGGITCAHVDEDTMCSAVFTLETISTQLPHEQLQKLLRKSLDAYVDKHPDELKRCPDPDCPCLYEPSAKDAQPTAYCCEGCALITCTLCGQEHDETSDCPEYDNEALKNALVELDARECPNCNVAIEKNEGCNHMTCPYCSTHICWFCMQTFEEDRLVYQHMTKEHGKIGEGAEFLDVEADGAPIADEAMMEEQRAVEAQARNALFPVAEAELVEANQVVVEDDMDIFDQWPAEVFENDHVDYLPNLSRQERIDMGVERMLRGYTGEEREKIEADLRRTFAMVYDLYPAA